MAREQAEKASIKGTQSETSPNSQTSTSFPSSGVKAPSSADISSATVEVVASSPVAVVPVIAASEIQPTLVSVPSTSPVITSSVVANADGVPKSVDSIATMIDDSSIVGEAVTENTVAETKYLSIAGL